MSVRTSSVPDLEFWRAVREGDVESLCNSFIVRVIAGNFSPNMCRMM